MTDELAYHLRELRADLRLIQGEIENVGAGRGDPMRAWALALALLEHDHEVHIARALTLLHASMPTAAPTDDGDNGALAVGRHVAAALAALGDEAIPPAARISSAGEAIDAARQISGLTVEQMARSARPPLS